MMNQVIRLGLMPKMLGMILMEHGGDSLYNDSSNFTGLIDIENLVKETKDERYRWLLETSFFLTGKKDDNTGSFVWGNDIEIDPCDCHKGVRDEDAVYLWDEADPVLGQEILGWEAPSYRGRKPINDPVLRFGLFPDRADVFLCEFDWSHYIGGKRGTYLVNVERFIKGHARDESEYERYRQLLRPEILEQAHKDFAGWLFWPYNLFISGFALGNVSEEAEKSLWEKVGRIVYPKEDKEKPEWNYGAGDDFYGK